MQITKELLSNLGALSLEHYYLLYCKYYTNGMLVTYRPRDSVYSDLIIWGYLTPSKSISSKGKEFLEDLWVKSQMAKELISHAEAFEEF